MNGAPADCPDRVKAILASLQIPLESLAARSLIFHPEARDLVVAETDATGREHLLIAPAAEAWRAMKAAASADGIVIRIVSAFRTIDRQAEIVRAKMEKGLSLESILCVSAPPGYSEHHSGRAIDLTTEGVRPLEQEFEHTDAFRWLSTNAGRFGFALSFPPNNRYGYAYEPWHWCFVRTFQLRVEGKSCVVRDWARSDKASLLRFANNRKVWRNLTHRFPHPYTEADAEWWFGFLERMPEPTHWAIEVQGQAVGGIGVMIGEGVFAKSGRFGYWLGEEYWGRGIMTQAVKIVAPYVMSRFGLVRLEAPVFAWNPASMRVLEKCGFTREGVASASVFKDGELIDQFLYARVERRDG